MRSRLASLVGVGLLAAASTADAAAEESAERPFSISATAYAYFVPDEPDFVMAIVPADVGVLHVEGRYNYEARNSGSAFVGLNARWGEKVKLAVTPMFGGVAGDLDGVIPALRLTVDWWRLELYSESEVVFDLDESGGSFFYIWSELAILPVTWLRTGVVVQRTHVYQTSLDTQRGLFVSGTYRFATLSLYEFNLGWTTPTWVIALGVAF
ncbi:MAG TPA: hypothetical protein VNG89_20840 [Vicinamibacterales bacterium]|jgi:hypothetical protein|nr:hypothetical protein [Vicinamibacterales bacterium]